MLLIALAVSIVQSSCRTERSAGCEIHIKEEIQPGMPLAIAEADLKKCGFKTTTDPVKKMGCEQEFVETSGPLGVRVRAIYALGRIPFIRLCGFGLRLKSWLRCRFSIPEAIAS
jgi:hypothetical protein